MTNSDRRPDGVKRGRRAISLGLATALMLAAVSGCDSTDAEAPAAQEGTLEAIERELTLGDEGADVAAVHSYLRGYGYFPNAQLGREFPRWRPMFSEDVANPRVFDAKLEGAVRAFQSVAGVEATGVVDAPTLDAMKLPRCAHPDNEFAAASKQGNEKWSFLGHPFFANNTPNWRVTAACVNVMGQPACLAAANVTTELTGAFGQWQAESRLTFSQLASGQPNIEIRFYTGTSHPTGWPDLAPAEGARGGWIGNQAIIAVNTGHSINSSAAGFRAVVLHEIGHVLNLNHGIGVPGNNGMRTIANAQTDRAVMYFSSAATVLTLDDREGVLTTYGAWRNIPSVALDIGVGGTSVTAPAIWVTDPNGAIWQRVGNNWTLDTSGGNAASIAVTEGGRPWVVTNDNLVFRKGSNSATSSNWGLPIGNSARDIGIGGPTGTDSVWIISNVSVGSGNFAVRRWNGTATGAGSFVDTPAGGFGTRVTVDARGFPWVVQANGNIWVNLSTNGSVAWTQVTGGASCARDIGAGRFTVHTGSNTTFNTPGIPTGMRPIWGIYVAGCQNIGQDNDLWVFNYQAPSNFVLMTPTGNFNDSAPNAATWWPLDGAARRVAVGPDGRAYVVQAGGQVFVRARP